MRNSNRRCKKCLGHLENSLNCSSRLKWPPLDKDQGQVCLAAHIIELHTWNRLFTNDIGLNILIERFHIFKWHLSFFFLPISSSFLRRMCSFSQSGTLCRIFLLSHRILDQEVIFEIFEIWDRVSHSLFPRTPAFLHFFIDLKKWALC